MPFFVAIIAVTFVSRPKRSILLRHVLFLSLQTIRVRLLSASEVLQIVTSIVTTDRIKFSAPLSTTESANGVIVSTINLHMQKEHIELRLQRTQTELSQNPPKTLIATWYVCGDACKGASTETSQREGSHIVSMSRRC